MVDENFLWNDVSQIGFQIEVLVGPTAEVASNAAKDFQATTLILFRCISNSHMVLSCSILMMELHMFREQIQNVQKKSHFEHKKMMSRINI